MSNILPGPFNYLNKVLTPSERKQQTFGAKTLAYVGLRAAPIDPVDNRIQQIYEKRSEVGKKLSTLRQRKHPANDQPIRADNPTPEYNKLLLEYSKLDKELAAKRVTRGDAVVPSRGRPSTTRTLRPRSGGGVPSGGFLGGSSSSTPSGGFLNP